MTTVLAPIPVFKAFNNNGQPLAGGQLWSYSAGTTTPIPTYTDSTGGTPNSNPTILNSRGEAQIWLIPNVAYKFVLQDSSGNQIWAVDQIVNNVLVTLYGGVDLGSPNVYNLNFTSSFSALSDGIIVYWIPANTNTGPATVTVNGLGPFPIINGNGPSSLPLIAGQIYAGQPVEMMWLGSNWLLLTGSFVGNTSGVQGYGSTAAGLVDMTPDKGSWTTTLTGPWIGGNNPTGIMKWSKQGNLVSIWTDATITQTATLAVAITALGLPAEITPSSNRFGLAGGLASGVVGGNTMAVVSVTTSNTLVITPMFTTNAANPTQVRDGQITTNAGTWGLMAGFSVLYAL